LANAIRKAVREVTAKGSSPCEVDEGYQVTIHLESPVRAGPTVGMPWSALEESVLAVVQDYAAASALLAAGDIVAKRIAAGELHSRPPWKVAKPSQKELVRVDPDGTIFTGAINGPTLIKKQRKLLAHAGAINAYGIEISVSIGKKSFVLTPVAQDATKANLMVVKEETWTESSSGFLENHKIVELTHDEKCVMLVVPANNADFYPRARREGKAVKMTVGISMPSNPLLPDEPKIRIAETLAVVDLPGQEAMEFSDK
jgi:hypothetical protein